MSDQIDRYAPALSATSDMPTEAPPAPEPAAPASDPPPPPEQTPEPAHSEPEPPALSESVQPAPEPEPTVEAEPEPRGVGKALAAKDRAIAEARAQAEQARRETQAAIRAMEQLTERLPIPPKEPAQPVEAADTRPGREQFNSPEEYDTALVEWAGRAASRAAEARIEAREVERRKHDEETTQRQKVEQENQKVVLAWNERKAKLMEQHYDYTEVAERSDLAITQNMAAAIVHAENGPEVAYHLGKNPAEATRIAGLSDGMQLFEIGRISANLAKPKPNVSRAPDPIRPLRSSTANASEKSADEMTMDEYGAKRQAQIEAARRRPGQTAVH